MRHPFHQEAEEEMELREAFRILDKDNQGTISVSVLKEIIMVCQTSISIEGASILQPICVTVAADLRQHQS